MKTRKLLLISSTIALSLALYACESREQNSAQTEKTVKEAYKKQQDEIAKKAGETVVRSAEQASVTTSASAPKATVVEMAVKNKDASSTLVTKETAVANKETANSNREVVNAAAVVQPTEKANVLSNKEPFVNPATPKEGLPLPLNKPAVQ